MATWTNPKTYSYLRKSDLSFLLKSDGYKIIINSYLGSNIWPNTSKNTATFSNSSRNTATWANTSRN